MTHTCQHCGHEIKRKRYANGSTESISQWAGKRFCSNRCSGDARTAARSVLNREQKIVARLIAAWR